MKKIPDDIKQMDERIRKLKAKEQRTREEKTESQFAHAAKVGFRIGAELISGVIVGAGFFLFTENITKAKIQFDIGRNNDDVGRGFGKHAFQTGGDALCGEAFRFRMLFAQKGVEQAGHGISLISGMGRGFPRQFVGQRGAQDEDGATQFRRAEGLVQEEGGQQDGGDGIHIAEHGRGLGRETAHSREEQDIDQARVDDAHHQQQEERGRRGSKTVQMAAQQHIGQHDQGGGAELAEGGLQRIQPAQTLVEEDEGTVEQGGRQPEGDAARVLPAAGEHAGDAHGPQHGQQGADDLAAGQAFAEHQGREQDDEDRRHVIAERGHGDARMAEGLEEEDPVEAQGRAGEQEAEGILADGLTVQGRFFQAQHQQQEEGADDGPGTGDDRRGQRDVVDEEADAAHDEHGGGQFAFFHDLVPCGSFSVRQGLRACLETHLSIMKRFNSMLAMAI